MQEMNTIETSEFQNISKNYNLIYSYKNILKSYNQYCKVSEKENWNKSIDTLFNMIIFEPTIFKFEFNIFKDTAIVMELFYKGYTVIEIKKIIPLQRLLIINKILSKYSIYQINYPKIIPFENYKIDNQKTLYKTKKNLRKSSH